MPFHIIHQLPLGSSLDPIGLSQNHNISSELEELFKTMNLYGNKNSYEQKREKFNRLSIIFKETFNEETLQYFTCSFFSYGSFRLVNLLK